MAATPEQRDALGRRLKELRTARGLTQTDVVNALEDNGGAYVSEQSLSEYERGISAPNAKNAAALERILGEPEGALGGIIGYRGDDPSTDAQLTELREIVKQQGEQIDEVLRLLRRRGGRGS